MRTVLNSLKSNYKYIWFTNDTIYEKYIVLYI